MLNKIQLVTCVGKIMMLIVTCYKKSVVEKSKIKILDNGSYVAIERSALRQAMNYLAEGKVKGRGIKVRRMKAQR